MRPPFRALTAVAAVATALAVASPATAEPAWAPADQAAITPGSATFTEGGQCTSNFVFHDSAGVVYLGQAAHCAGTGGPAATNGCESHSLPLGTPVEVEGAQQPGTLVYSSWLAMQGHGETDPAACSFNDFALVRLSPLDAARVNPTIPFWGGPTSLGADGRAGEKVLSYGASSLRLGLTALSPKEGHSLGQSAGGWTHTVLTVTFGIPGDSGSAVVDGSGRALGVVSTLQILPVPGGNGVSDLARAVGYMEATGGPQVELALGTEGFRGPLLPL